MRDRKLPLFGDEMQMQCTGRKPHPLSAHEREDDAKKGRHQTSVCAMYIKCERIYILHVSVNIKHTFARIETPYINYSRCIHFDFAVLTAMLYCKHESHDSLSLSLSLSRSSSSCVHRRHGFAHPPRSMILRVNRGFPKDKYIYFIGQLVHERCFKLPAPVVDIIFASTLARTFWRKQSV